MSAARYLYLGATILLSPALPATVGAMDGAILVVSAADGPMPAAELTPRIKLTLEAAGVQYSETDLEFLAERAARAVASPRSLRAPIEVCVPAGSPCVVVTRE